MKLSDIQQEIVDCSGNLIVRASAGTGKTHTMVAKIENELENNHTHKLIAAITFTIKAAKEIRERLTIDTSDCFIGTNNSFAIEEIIKPFARDVYGEEYNFDITTNYSLKKDTFEECLEYLRIEHTVCSYNDNKKNFVFELALAIVKKSEVCRKYLKARYFKIYVDEYQDCDKTMHEFFMYICNEVGINFFVVGDDKQSIYIWRGAYPDAFKSILRMDSFSKLQLRENYRSCLQIQNYSNLLNDDTFNLYKPLSDKSSIILVTTKKDSWVRDIVTYLDMNKSCALLRFSNSDAKIGANALSITGTDFTYVPKTPISDITTDVSWLYFAIAQYFILPKYSVYDFVDEIPEESIGDKKIIGFIKNKLSKIGEALSTNDDDCIIEVVKNIANYFNYVPSDDHIRQMISTIVNKEFHSAFQMDELSHVGITFHSSKGLEYDQVIIFANDYALNKQDSIYNHYVAVTRAKSKLIIVKIDDANGWAGNVYYNNLDKLIKSRGVNVEDVLTII